jgi:hypothetical protein
LTLLLRSSFIRMMGSITLLMTSEVACGRFLK